MSGQTDQSCRHIVLIGFMAAGKSVVGRELAARRQLKFTDTDQLVTERHGPIPELFSARGECYFREVEARCVAAALAEKPCAVISLGGGAVLDTGTQQLLRRSTVVFLDTDLETVLPRIIRSGHRPMLAGDPVRRWQELAKARRPVYESLADITIDTRGLTVTAIIDRLTTILNEGA
ncbi:shikimate kinase [Arthrobacter sp. zg-Y1219]|uniref:shikimate kinase n=1 Tax=Arthrobacter sp. zg-Y1219 TaxID=3049067 RepID=UPI0024C2282D|nr:shikimate kinase [Arthrobacter sp. zg-Y1219]MDK1359083.1 shikimate kinase [Arthrobacter sp. zg-Y1219]